MKRFILTFLKIAAFFIVWAVLAGLMPIPETTSPAIWRLWAEILPLLTVVTLTVIFWFIEKRNLDILMVKNPLHNLLVGIGVGSLWLGLSAAILFAVGAMKIVGVNEVAFLGGWILAAFLNVVMQELLFRGYMYQLIKKKYNVISAIIVTTALFTLMHGGAFEAGIIPVLNVITMSLFVSVALEYTHSLLVPVIIHAVWNVIGAVILGGVSLADDYPNLLNCVFTDNSIISGGSVRIEGSVVVLVLNVLFTGIFVYLITKKRNAQAT